MGIGPIISGARMITGRERVSGDTRDWVVRGSGGRDGGRGGRGLIEGASKHMKILQADVDRRGRATTNRGHTRGQAGPPKGADPADTQRRG